MYKIWDKSAYPMLYKSYISFTSLNNLKRQGNLTVKIIFFSFPRKVKKNFV